MLDNDTFELLFIPIQDKLKSLNVIEIDAEQIHLTWVRDNMHQHDIFYHDPYVIIDEDEFFLPTPMKPTPIDASLLQPVDEQSPLHILNALNDDCLAAIFEQSAFTLYDFEELTFVCKRFNWILTKVMRSPRHRYASSFFQMQRRQSLWRIEKFLRKYGESITYADLTEFNSSTVVLGMIAK